MKRLMNGLSGTLATLGAAIQASAAVESGRQPSRAALRQLGISESAFRKIGL